MKAALPAGSISPRAGGMRRALAAALLAAGGIIAPCLSDAAASQGDANSDPSAGCGRETIAHGARIERTTDVDGTARAYIIDAPDRVRPGEPAPLILDFHGLRHSAAGVWAISGFRELGGRQKFITVYPQGLRVNLFGHEGDGWEIAGVEGNRDLRFVAQLLDEMERDYCIDRRRIFATGFSNGAIFSSLLGCAMADRLAAIAPVGGGRIPVSCAPARGLPVLIHHGRADDRIPVAQARAARDSWIEINRCREHVSNDCEWHRSCRDGVEVGYCEDDSAHRWPAPATVRIWEFFTRHPKSTR